MIQVQESNTICATSVTTDELTTLCKLFTEDTSFIEKGDNIRTAMCCDTKWDVPEEYAICGKNLGLNLMVHGCVEEASYWNFDYQDGIYIDVILLCINAIICWVILIFAETNLIKKGYIKLMERIHGSTVSTPTVVDDDVQKEKESIYLENNLMKVINLTKKFGSFDAVRGLTFGVREKECFGLLGVNGAGKTTTFRFALKKETAITFIIFILQNDNWR